MKNLGLYFDDTLDRVGDETILFSFFQDSRHTRQIVHRCENDSGLYDDFCNLKPASLNLF